MKNQGIADYPMPNNVSLDPSGNKKVRLKSRLAVTRLKGVSEKSTDCINVHGEASNTDSFKDNTSTVSSESDGFNTKLSPTRISRPQTLNDQYAFTESELPNTARTFADSVINLSRRILVSSGDADSMQEGTFLMLVRICGFIQARCIAEQLGLAHKNSAALFSILLFGNHTSKHSAITDQPQPVIPS